jgi:hypothetical protein
MTFNTPKSPINAKSQQLPRTGTADKQKARIQPGSDKNATIKTPAQTNIQGGKENSQKGSINKPNQWHTSPADKNCSTPSRNI